MNDNEIIARYKVYEPFFGSWYIKRFIGEGGFAKVFEIVRNDFGTEYTSALKIITVSKTKTEIDTMKTEGMSEKDIRENLRGIVEDTVREIQLMYKLKGNGNIVGYEDHAVVEHEDGMGWDILIKMEFLTSLGSYIRNHQGRIAKRDVIKLGIDICKALESCQKYNIIHRDIKADNIFISNNGDFKLGDFGIARIIERKDVALSKKGTSAYMAPEVYKGMTYSSAVDIYSLGIVLYRLLNNNRGPFLPDYPKPISLDERDRALMQRMSGDKFPKPSQINTGRLPEIVLKACAYRPEERYSSPVLMRRELESILYDRSEVEEDELIMIYEEQRGESSFSFSNSNRAGEEDATEVLREDTPGAGAFNYMNTANAGVVNILCKKCGNAINRDVAFCPVCGASQRELQAESIYQKPAGQVAQPVQQASYYQGMAGQAVQQASYYQGVAGQSAPYPDTAKKKSSKKIIIIGGICASVFIVLGVIVGVTVSLSSSGRSSDRKDTALNETKTWMTDESTVAEETRPQESAEETLNDRPTPEPPQTQEPPQTAEDPVREAEGFANGNFSDAYHQDFTAEWQNSGYGSQGWHETFLYANEPGRAMHLLYVKPSTMAVAEMAEIAILWEGPIMDDYRLEEDLVLGLYETQNGADISRLRVLALNISGVSGGLSDLEKDAVADLFDDTLLDSVVLEESDSRYVIAYQVNSDWNGGAEGLIYCIEDYATGTVYMNEYLMQDAYYNLETAANLVVSIEYVNLDEYGIDKTRGILGDE